MANTGDALRNARTQRRVTQVELARRAGISRQALGAIEAGVYQPSVTVALSLARELAISVEELFGSSAEAVSRRIQVPWPEPSARPGAMGRRVTLARVGGKVVAVPQPRAALALAPAAGTLERAGRNHAEVVTFLSAEEIDSTLLIAGCDPAVAILTDWLARHRSAIRAVALPCSSGSALTALIEGRAHAAGVHLRDPASGEYNQAPVRQVLGRRRAMLVSFARWELGLATRPGNPLGLRGFADLARPEVRLANREPGSGARAALDEALALNGIRPSSIAGYTLELAGHLEVAAAIAADEANAGVTLRVAAEAYGLVFIPLREERYDLVIAAANAASAPVKALLEALNSQRFAREVSQFCGYDTAQMGRIAEPAEV